MKPPFPGRATGSAVRSLPEQPTLAGVCSLNAPGSRPRRLLRWTLRLLLGLTAALALVLLAGYGWMRYGLPQTSGRTLLPGLQQDVGLYRDTDGVPHIFAANEGD